MSYGWELVLDLHECKEDRFTPEAVEQFCVEVCELIGMKREDFHLWADDPEERDETPAHLYGVSAVQFITTSNLVVHALPKLRKAFINIFSCQKFDALLVERYAMRCFGGYVVSRHLLERL